MKECIFDDNLRRKSLEFWEEAIFPQNMEVQPGQPMRLFGIEALGCKGHDKDAHLPRYLAENDGAPLGVEEILQAPPGVLAPVTNDEDSSDEEPLMAPSENYTSAVEEEEALAKQYAEDESEGLSSIFTTDEAAATECGCTTSDLIFGAQAVRTEKGDKKRVIHDGSADGPNPKIRRNMKGKTQCPRHPDLHHILAVREKYDEGDTVCTIPAIECRSDPAGSPTEDVV